MKQVWLNIKSQKLISMIILSSIIVGISSVYILFVIRTILADQLAMQLSQLGENNFVATFMSNSGNIGLHPVLQYEKIQELTKNQSDFRFFPYSIIGSEFIYPKQMIFRGGAELSSNRSVVPLHDCCGNSEGNNAENLSVKGIEGNKKYSGLLLAVGENFQALNIKAIHGRLLNQQDKNHKVIMLGKNLALSINSMPKQLIDQYIQYQDQLFNIIGIYEVSAPNLADEDFEQAGLISYPLALRLTENVQLDHLYVIGANSNKNNSKASIINKITVFYQNNIGVGVFHIKDADFILARIKTQFAQIEYMLQSICFVALGLGSILLIQIFLLSLDKRRFEIGIRLACGAAPKDILIQFIQESFFYYLIGGGIGIIIGVILIVAWKLVYQEAWSYLALFSGLFPVVLTVFFLAVGLGLIPGMRSLRLHPMAFFKPGL